MADLVAALEREGYTVHRKGDKPKPAILGEKYFRLMDKFGGNEESWSEWIFRLCVTIGPLNQECQLGIESMLKTPETTAMNRDGI